MSESSVPISDLPGERYFYQVCVMSGVQVVPHDRTDTPTPPAVDLSLSPSSRHTPSSPEMTNGNYVPSGVSMTDIYPPMQAFHHSFSFYVAHKYLYHIPFSDSAPCC